MKRIALLLATIVGVGMLVGISVQPAYAAFNLFQDTCTNPGDSSVCSDANKGANQNSSSNSIYGKNSVLARVVNLLSIVIGIVAVIVIIIAGLRFIVSGGDATKVATAKSTILFAIVGLVVAALAQAMIAFVLNRL